MFNSDLLQLLSWHEGNGLVMFPGMDLEYKLRVERGGACAVVLSNFILVVGMF